MQRTCHCTPTRTLLPLCSVLTLICSVYVRNLEERIKVEQLKEALTELFSEYGEIIDIVAKTNLKAKGQAFIVFNTVESAQKAIDEIQGFELFDKPMQLAFAKTRSDASVKRTGGDDEFESHKRRRLAEKGIVLWTM
jgi:RNA recognition motif-containing protein